LSWSFAVPDWRERLAERRSLVPTLPLWDDQARMAIAAFDRLRIADVPGTPRMAEAGGDWFREIVGVMLGCVDPLTRKRMVRELFLLVGKKNGKTTNGALLMLTAVLLNKRPHAEFLFVAPTMKIAELAFSQAAGAISLDPWLDGQFSVQDSLKKITHTKTRATLQIKSFDPKVLTGCRPAGALFDELHVIGAAPEADRVIRQVRSGMITQSEGFLIFITTQSEREPSGVFLSELKRARAVRDGERADSLLPVLYEFPPEIGKAKKDEEGRYPWEDTSLWSMVTPSLGQQVPLAALVETYESARLDGEPQLLGWASQHLNVEIGLLNRVGAWNGAQYWEGSADKEITLDALLERCDVVTIGIDCGSSDDILSLYVIGRLPADGGEEMSGRKWIGWGHSWCNQKALDARKRENSRYRDFESCGDLTIVKHDNDLLHDVAEMVRRIDASGKLALIGVDKNGLPTLVDTIAETIDETDERIQAVYQGGALMKHAEALDWKLFLGKFRHADQPIMRYAIENAKLVRTKDGFMFDKFAPGWAKIDPFIAALCAVAAMTTNPEAPTQVSAYEHKDLLVFRIGA
jgi:phage terminase large subunit-like protein